MARLLERYHKEILPRLAEKLGRTNVHSLPKLQKIVVNMGVGKALQDKNRMEQAAEQLTQITGQKSQITKAQGGRQRLPPARGQRDRLPGDAARPAHVRVPRSPHQRRPASYS